MKAVVSARPRLIPLLIVSLLLAAPAWAAEVSPEIQVRPDVVEIGAFFNGQEVKISAKIPQGAQAVIEIIGQTATEHLMRKGRRGGLWMNVGEVEVQGAPSVYLAASTSAALLKDPPAGAVWGYPALKQRIQFAGRVEQGEREYFLDQFFQLKESDEVYAIFPGVLKVKGDSGDSQTVTGAFPLPTNVRPGDLPGLPHGGSGRPGNRQAVPRPAGGHGGVSGHDGIFGL